MSGTFKEEEKIYTLWDQEGAMLGYKGIAIIFADVAFTVYLSETLRA